MENLKWIFSGIGVALLVILLSPLRKYFLSWAENYMRRFPSIERKQLEAWIDDDTYKSRPTSREIIRSVNQIPPAQQDHAEKQYEGLNVVWSLNFYTLHSQKENQVRLMMHFQKSYPWVYCIVDTNDYPEIKTVLEGRLVWVAGTIVSVDGHNITLRDVKLRFI